MDRLKNGTETDVDCGGSCPKCATGLSCKAATDCTDGVCKNVCQAPSCVDGVKNGLESDVDCGGGICPKCVDGKKCAGAGDCQSGACSAMKVCGM
jgi:hypothetical protein